MRRSGRFWRQHEREIITALGYIPTPISGAGWIKKEDGEDDDFHVQLKSTEKKSASIKLDDLITLFSHAAVSHKIPVFVVEFVGEAILVAFRPDDVPAALAAVVKRELKTEQEAP